MKIGSTLQLPETRDIPINAIAIRPERLRALRPEAVAALAESMRQQGQLQPVVIRQREGAGYWLIAGRHRIAAANELKWESVRASIFDAMTGDQAELAEIDENLIRADLSPAERAAHIAARKVIYERLHPETVRGAVGRGGKKSRQNGDNSENEDRFTKATAEATGKSERAVQREAHRGEAIPDVGSIAGTSLDKGEELDALASLPREKQTQLIDRAIAGEKVSAKSAAKQEKRETRERVLGGLQLALPTKKYGVILADPEWRFEPWSRTTGMDRAADNHYPTSCTEVIAARDVPSIAADDCVLFLWATAPMLPHALVVMAAWGFDYRSQVIWTKTRDGAGHGLRKLAVGTGYWFRSAHELLLVGIKGDKIPAPAMGTQWASAIDAPIGAHSVKPDCFLEMIEEYFPTLPKIELNRRGPARPNWDAWGNESDATPAGAVMAARSGVTAGETAPHDPNTGEIQDSIQERPVHLDSMSRSNGGVG